MAESTTNTSSRLIPDLSLIIPCYNEGDAIRNTAVRLTEAFGLHKLNLELVLVDNGSKDHTGEVIDDLIREGFPVVKGIVEINEGYGKGILQGLPHCRADLIGFLCADEQVEAADVVKLYQIAAKARTPRLFKVRRRFRLEGAMRRVVSGLYNLSANVLFGELGTMDLNANPKIMHRSFYEAMQLNSKDWFLDAEVMIKAKSLGLPVFELNVFSQMRSEGRSNVKPTTCYEFVMNMLRYRLSHREELRRLEQGSATNVETILQGK
jgi:glycosyltransferase involved in cell wall biosynthesis